ncbi:hypothetical protein [Streptomyces sp. NBC_00996]|uniref:hypothetical protein n=1 Tax=Streptomyces sp. NBC_00996 TaxID=2903710 RepID=UPI003870AA37|nr:hypothetical protein OG390_15100 [Streptomyces sp. NBC_00996]
MDTHHVERTAAARLCGGAGCAAREPRPALGRSRLCHVCAQRLAADLERLPGLYRSCESMLESSRHSGVTAGGRGAGGPVPGIRLNTRAAEVRASILSVLGSWGGLVAHERRVATPSRTVTALADFLRLHVTWLAAHETAADASGELNRLVHAARRLIEPESVRRLEIGACAEPDCVGSLVARVHTGGAALSDIVCTAAPAHRWPAAEWTRLGRRLGAGSRPGAPGRTEGTGHAGGTRRASEWLSPAEVAHLRGVPSGTVYRLASEHQWRRDKRAGRTYYWAQDVERTFHATGRTPR